MKTVTNVPNSVQAATLNEEQQSLWNRLSVFPLNDPQFPLDFTARLARENGWPRLYAERVCEEYRRFLFLSVVAGHVVTPSEEVDQAWHLHLVYTRSYWKDLCQGVLGRDLHHHPTTGAFSDSKKFHALYSRTLESYRTFFGDEPPSDIWPPVAKRFAHHEHRWVDVARAWVIPRPVWLRLPALAPSASVLLLVAALSLVLPACTENMRLLNARGPEFLAWYTCFLIGAIITSVIIGKMVRENRADAPEHLDDPFDAAFLAGGGRRVMDTALASLYEKSLIEVRTEKGRNEIRSRENSAKRKLHPVEAQLYNSLDAVTWQRLSIIRLNFRSAAEKVQAKLQQNRLIAAPSQRSMALLFVALPFLLVMGLGIAKLFIGLDRGRPVVALIFLLFITFVVMCVRLAGVARRTIAGDQVLKKMQRDIAGQPLGDHGMAGAFPLSVALLGVAALPAGASDLRNALATQTGSSSVASGCGSGCGGSDSSSSSGGDSGGGDGGGGGCGGCGGGGGD